MTGGNVTIGQFTAATTSAVAGDSFAAYQATASTTVRFLATQIAQVVFNQTATAITMASGSVISSAGNFTLGAGVVLATTAVSGHVMIPSCAGTPTASVIGATGGNIPMVVDTTGYNLYFLLPSGVWRKTALT